MKELLDCEDISYYNKVLAEHSNIQLERYNECKLDNKIKEKRLRWLGRVQDYIIYKYILKIG